MQNFDVSSNKFRNIIKDDAFLEINLINIHLWKVFKMKIDKNIQLIQLII